MDYHQTDSFISTISEFVKAPRFDSELQAEFTQWVTGIEQDWREGKIDKAIAKQLPHQVGRLFPLTTMHGHAINKPRVYSGDFELIDKIYTQYCSPFPKWSDWDMYFHNLPVFQALRNRKQYLQQLLAEVYQGRQAQTFELFNVYAGPCRAIRDFLLIHPNANVRVDCLDIDRYAIQYASALMGHLNSHVRYFNKNIFQYRPLSLYDMVWAGGLFNYLEDRLFIQMLRHLGKLLKPGGTFVMGCISNRNPNQAYLELLLEWKAYHRSEEQLTMLVEQASSDLTLHKIEQGESDIFMFLHIGHK